MPWSDQSSDGTVAAGNVGAVVQGDRPPIEWPAPVDPTPASIDAARERTDALLAHIPGPLTTDDVPNGVVRQSIASNRRDAIDGRPPGDATRYRELRTSPAAREAARHARTTFGAIERGTEALVSDLRSERADAIEVVRTRRDAIDYRGPETIAGASRAALFAHQHEAALVRADRTLEEWRVHPEDTVIDIGAAAGEVERASATASVWSHLFDRYAADLTDPVSLESTFSEAVDRSLDRIATVDFPDQEDDDWYEAVGVDDVDDQVLEFALRRAGRDVVDAVDGVGSASSAGRLGTALYRALTFEVRYRAFETFRDRIQAGSFEWPASISAIQAERSAALETAEAVRDSMSGPTLAALARSETLRSIKWTDERVERAADNDPAVRVSLDDEYRDYALAEAKLAALPDATEAVRDRLGGL
ncbi:hypothetical protein [Halovivax limisalsi]|uniref:hypothetical protein n=1 Tax=Halovivax limisalsi TaxID=1453760 RepID=UPI001FFC6A15|nr:hypothetical protein [Halovivax limisalsi]